MLNFLFVALPYQVKQGTAVRLLGWYQQQTSNESLVNQIHFEGNDFSVCSSPSDLQQKIMSAIEEFSDEDSSQSAVHFVFSPKESVVSFISQVIVNLAQSFSKLAVYSLDFIVQTVALNLNQSQETGQFFTCWDQAFKIEQGQLVATDFESIKQYQIVSLDDTFVGSYFSMLNLNTSLSLGSKAETQEPPKVETFIQEKQEQKFKNLWSTDGSSIKTDLQVLIESSNVDKLL